MHARVTKAVIPAAGLGTRFLPATKSVPKEMMPVVDKPAIHYVVEEAARAGIDDVLVVTGRNKGAIEDYFDRAYELEDTLERAEGKRDLLDRVRDATELATLHFVRQKDPRGLGHAVACAQPHVGDAPFAVLLGDDLIDERDPLLQQMIAVHNERGGCVLGLLEVPREQISLYGCASVESGDGDVVRVTGLVEKPSVDEAPSNLALIGRYVLTPQIFDVLGQTQPGRGGEIQVTDAIAALVDADPDQGGPVWGVVFRGRRYDTGDKADYLRSIVQLACDRADLGPEFRAWLAEFLTTRLREGDPAEPVRP
jgi:UTP--glucose-1-phosphate uridylyltransferase